MERTRQPWIVSAPFDLALVAIPLLASLAVLAVPVREGQALALWAFLLLVVAFDVAHVWATLYLGYLDGETFRRRRLLFLLPIPLCFVVAYRLHAHSAELFWTLLAYVAIHHFIAQQWGFVALYRLRAGERDPVDRHLDKWTLWAGALGPLLLVHASPERAFDWFGAGERFLFTLDPALAPDILAATAGLGAIYLARQLHHARRGTFNWGKNVWMLAAWASWAVGVGWAGHPLVALACVNLLHGIPFLGLVWFRGRRRWEGRVEAGSPPAAWFFQPGRWWAFYGLILLLALVEEALWDYEVWGVYAPSLGLAPAVAEPGGSSFWVALLALPQMVHYLLDGWLWKLDGSNPDLEAALGLRR